MAVEQTRMHLKRFQDYEEDLINFDGILSLFS